MWFANYLRKAFIKDFCREEFVRVLANNWLTEKAEASDTVVQNHR